MTFQHESANELDASRAGTVNSLVHLEENIAAGSLTLTPEDLADLDVAGEQRR
jgi:hypothetical protein